MKLTLKILNTKYLKSFCNTSFGEKVIKKIGYKLEGTPSTRLPKIRRAVNEPPDYDLDEALQAVNDAPIGKDKYFQSEDDKEKMRIMLREYEPGTSKMTCQFIYGLYYNIPLEVFRHYRQWRQGNYNENLLLSEISKLEKQGIACAYDLYNTVFRKDGVV